MSSKIEVCKTCLGSGIEYDGSGHTCTACNGINSRSAEPLGVEPTLRDHCQQCAEVVKTWPESKRDCLGKVEPVVERPAVAPFYISAEDWNLLVRGDIDTAPVRISRTRRGKFTESLFAHPPELAELQAEVEQFREWRNEKNLEMLAIQEDANNQFAANLELQATVARLTAENEWLKDEADSQYAKRVAVVDEIERLKGGQGETVAMSRDQFESWVLGREHPLLGWLGSSWLSRGDKTGTYANDYVQGLWVASQTLLASQPAPVSVPDGWKLVPIEPTEVMLNVLHGRVLISVNSRKKEANILNDKAWWKAVVESAPACLDKVKELNQ